MDLMDRTPTQRAAVELHIDELVLHGFRSGDRHAIVAAMKRELSLLIASGNLDASAQGSVHVERIDGGSLRLSGNATPGQIGRSVARNVYRQIGVGAAATPPSGGGQGHA